MAEYTRGISPIELESETFDSTEIYTLLDDALPDDPFGVTVNSSAEKVDKPERPVSDQDGTRHDEQHPAGPIEAPSSNPRLNLKGSSSNFEVVVVSSGSESACLEVDIVAETTPRILVGYWEGGPEEENPVIAYPAKLAFGNQNTLVVRIGVVCSPRNEDEMQPGWYTGMNYSLESIARKISFCGHFEGLAPSELILKLQDKLSLSSSQAE